MCLLPVCLIQSEFVLKMWNTISLLSMHTIIVTCILKHLAEEEVTGGFTCIMLWMSVLCVSSSLYSMLDCGM